MAGDESGLEQAREMVESQVVARGVVDRSVLAAMRSVPRHRFVPSNLRDRAYEDHPLGIGEGQTISQPYIVALMTSYLRLEGGERVLEVGTGSGYQAAVLSRIVEWVFTVETRETLFRRACRTFEALDYTNITPLLGDGYYGYPDCAPFDAVIITAATGKVPRPLLHQLRVGGRMILPYGTPPDPQRLTLVTRFEEEFGVEHLSGVMFVPMTGRAERS